jgi:NADH dehydrogenase
MSKNGADPPGKRGRTKKQKPRVVIVGAGFGGLTAAKELDGKNVDVVLLDRNNYHLFQPLLYQVATAGLEPEAIAYPVRTIFRNSRNVRFRLAEVLAIDRRKKQVMTDGRGVRYDYLIVAPGAETNFFDRPAIALHCRDLKRLGDAIDLRNQVLYAFERAAGEEDEEERRSWLTIVVVGGGPTGVELAGAFAELVRYPVRRDFPGLDFSEVKIILMEGTGRLLEGFPGRLSREAVTQLERLGVRVMLRTLVDDVQGDVLRLADGKSVRAKTVVWAAGVKAVSLGRDLAPRLARGGRVPVTPELHLPDDQTVYVIGDLASLDLELPQMAPVAIQQARVAAGNILRHIEGRPLGAFRYRNRGMMTTIGRSAAVATIYGAQFTGFLAWSLWLTVHFFWLIGFRNKLLVMINWAYNYFTYDRSIRLITRKPSRESSRRASSSHSESEGQKKLSGKQSG